MDVRVSLFLRCLGALHLFGAELISVLGHSLQKHVCVACRTCGQTRLWEKTRQKIVKNRKKMKFRHGCAIFRSPSSFQLNTQTTRKHTHTHTHTHIYIYTYIHTHALFEHLSCDSSCSPPKKENSSLLPAERGPASLLLFLLLVLLLLLLLLLYSSVLRLYPPPLSSCPSSLSGKSFSFSLFCSSSSSSFPPPSFASILLLCPPLCPSPLSFSSLVFVPPLLVSLIPYPFLSVFSFYLLSFSFVSILYSQPLPPPFHSSCLLGVAIKTALATPLWCGCHTPSVRPPTP